IFLSMKLSVVTIALAILQLAASAAYLPKDISGSPLVDGEKYCVFVQNNDVAEHGRGFLNTQGGSWLRIGSVPQTFTFKDIKPFGEQRFTLAKDEVFKMSGDRTRLPCSKSFMTTENGGKLEQFVAREEHQDSNGHYYYKMMVSGHCGVGASCADYDVIGIKEEGTEIKYLYAIDEAC
ncbi:hypothetical protein BGZ75_002524, partial [Mortierella antarctica]